MLYASREFFIEGNQELLGEPIQSQSVYNSKVDLTAVLVHGEFPSRRAWDMMVYNLPDN